MTRKNKKYLHDNWSTSVANQKKGADYPAAGNYPQGVVHLAAGRIAIMTKYKDM